MSEALTRHASEAEPKDLDVQFKKAQSTIDVVETPITNTGLTAPQGEESYQTRELEGYSVPGFSQNGGRRYNQIRFEFPMRKGLRFNKISLELYSAGDPVYPEESKSTTPYGPIFSGLYARIIPNNFGFN
jgi:hypothetical protein